MNCKSCKQKLTYDEEDHISGLCIDCEITENAELENNGQEIYNTEKSLRKWFQNIQK